MGQGTERFKGLCKGTPLFLGRELFITETNLHIPPEFVKNLGMVKAGIACQPILHRDKDFMIQSTYHRLGGRGQTHPWSYPKYREE